MNILLLYFFLINSTTFILAGYDKRMAVKRKRRIPENTLFTVAFFGGSIGLLTAMLLFTHKTGKTSFIVKFSVIILIQLVLLYLKLTDKI
jgi:uncharacterized membrane protein YsdA (DUF1294 family)